MNARRGLVLALVLVGAVEGTSVVDAATPAPPSGTTALDTYRRDAESLLSTELVPRLERGRAARSDVPPFSVNVIPSRDPLRLDVQRRSDGTVDVTLSAAFVLFSDALVDAEVLGRLTTQRPLVTRYFDDIVTFAGVATRREAEKSSPGPFYTRLGWKKSLYDVTYASAEYQEPRSEVFVQAITWVVAHAVVAGVGGDGREADRIAAEWIAQSGFAPLPNVGISMLYFAARNPTQTRPAEWRCQTRSMLETSVEAVEGLRARNVSLPKEIPAELLARGRQIAADTAPGDACRHAARKPTRAPSP